MSHRIDVLVTGPALNCHQRFGCWQKRRERVLRTARTVAGGAVGSVGSATLQAAHLGSRRCNLSAILPSSVVTSSVGTVLRTGMVRAPRNDHIISATRCNPGGSECHRGQQRKRGKSQQTRKLWAAKMLHGRGCGSAQTRTGQRMAESPGARRCDQESSCTVKRARGFCN